MEEFCSLTFFKEIFVLDEFVFYENCNGYD